MVYLRFISWISSNLILLKWPLQSSCNCGLCTCMGRDFIFMLGLRNLAVNMGLCVDRFCLKYYAKCSSDNTASVSGLECPFIRKLSPNVCSHPHGKLNIIFTPKLEQICNFGSYQLYPQSNRTSVTFCTN